MSAIAYASGRYARGLCDKCGLEVKYLQLVRDGHWRDLRVCPECFDPRHPQERLLPVHDAVALWRPTPQDRHAPTAPVLSGQNYGTTNSLTWSAATSQDSRVAGYRLYRDETQIADVEIEADYTGAVLVDPRAYNDESLGDGSYNYVVTAYDLRGLESAPSNVISLTVASSAGLSFDITLGLVQSMLYVGYGYEVEDFASGNPPLTGAIAPDPPVIGTSTILAVWAWETGGLEIWFEGPLPTGYSTLRIEADGGTVELNLNAPDDSLDEGQSWLYYMNSGIWQAGENGQVRRITFLE